MFTSILSGAILMDYREAIQVLPLLLSFVPMLMDTSGNCGNQSSTMVIRGMAVGDIELKDVLRVVWKEFRVGLLCGAVLAAANFIRLILQYPEPTGSESGHRPFPDAGHCAGEDHRLRSADAGRENEAGSGDYGCAPHHHHRGRQQPSDLF